MAFIEMDFASGGSGYAEEGVVLDTFTFSRANLHTLTVPSYITNNNISKIIAIQQHPNAGTGYSFYLRDYKRHKLYYTNKTTTSTTTDVIEDMTELDWEALNADGSSYTYAPPLELGTSFGLNGGSTSTNYYGRVIYIYEK